MSFVSHLYGTAAQMAARNPRVPKGVLAGESDTGVVKMGDGVTLYNSLSPVLGGTYAGLTRYGRESLFTADATALQAWRAALANRHYSRANVVVIGDSIVEGQGATAFGRRWVDRLASNLRSRFPTTGVTGGQGFIGATTEGVTGLTWPAVKVNGASNVQFGPKRRIWGLGTTATFTYTVTGTAIDVMWVRKTSTDTFTVTVDGGAANTINTNGASVLDGRLTRISLGASGSHTVVVAGTVGNALFAGLIVYDGDESAGITVHECGRYGSQSGSWTSSIGAYTASTDWPVGIAALQPHLLIIAVGVNDKSGGTAPATMATNVQGIISQVKAVASTQFSTLIVSDYQPNNSGSTAWSSYVTALNGVADADSTVTALDLSLRMPAVSGDVLSLYADSLHPSNLGHSMIADLVTAAISPR